MILARPSRLIIDLCMWVLCCFVAAGLVKVLNRVYGLLARLNSGFVSLVLCACCLIQPCLFVGPELLPLSRLLGRSWDL